MDIFVNILKYIWAFIVSMIEGALSIFPKSPVRPFINSIDGITWYLARVNYIVPVSHFLDMLLAFVGILMLYYCLSILAKWIKLL